MRCEAKPICYLCGLHSDYLPSKSGRDLVGISCKRCGEYYVDGLLEKYGVCQEETNKKILSGYTRWERELGHTTPEITADNIEIIIRENRDYSDEIKIDKLLMYYSKKYPNKGSNVEFISDMDYPIAFSKNIGEFVYLLEKGADEYLGYIKVLSISSGGPPEGYFQITPKGWERIDWLNKIKLADDKYRLERQELLSTIAKDEAQMKEQANIEGLRWSSVLARRLRNLYLQSSLDLLAKRLQIDKEIIFEGKASLDAEELEILRARVNNLVDSEKAFLNTKLSEIYRNCHASEGYFKTDIADVISDIDRRHESILIDLEAAKETKQKPRHPELPEKDINELIKMDESVTLEFKSTFQWDMIKQEKNEKLRMEVVSTIAAFNNTDGGYILIGVEDNGNVFGLEKDYSLLKKQDRDGFLQLLVQEIENKITRSFLPKLKVYFHDIHGKDVCSVKINVGEDAVWLKEEFYIRTHNSTRALSPRESADYIRKKWGP